MIETIRQGLAEDGFKVSISKLCQWFDMSRRTVYYKSVKAEPKVQARFAEPIKAMINEEPSFGYRTVAALLGFNKNTVQRIFQLRGWQVKKRPIGFRPRVQALPSVARAPNQRWATDLCRVWAGRDGWLVLALVIDCHTRELLGWHLPARVKPTRRRQPWSKRSLPVLELWTDCRRHSCCGPITVWSSLAAATPRWCAVTACARNSSRCIAQNRTA